MFRECGFKVNYTSCGCSWQTAPPAAWSASVMKPRLQHAHAIDRVVSGNGSTHEIHVQRLQSECLFADCRFASRNVCALLMRPNLSVDMCMIWTPCPGEHLRRLGGKIQNVDTYIHLVALEPGPAAPAATALWYFKRTIEVVGYHGGETPYLVALEPGWPAARQQPAQQCQQPLRQRLPCGGRRRGRGRAFRAAFCHGVCGCPGRQRQPAVPTSVRQQPISSRKDYCSVTLRKYHTLAYVRPAYLARDLHMRSVTIVCGSN